jgi:hypothetical protein
METYQQRVVEEKQELDGRRDRLTTFIASKSFDNLDPAEQERMSRQLTVMTEYSDILGERIAAFPK